MSILIDTSAFIAYLSKEEKSHATVYEKMKEVLDGKFGAVFVSDYIFDETVTFAFRRFKNHEKITAFGQKILDKLEMIFVDSETFEKSWKLFKKHKKLSFTDCTNIALMENHGITHIMTYDAGFNGLVSVVN